MAARATRQPGGASSSGPSVTSPAAPYYAAATASNAPSNAPSHMPSNAPAPSETAPAKKRKHRGGKKRRNRRQSFAAPADMLDPNDMADRVRPSLPNVAEQADSRGSSTFYRLSNNQSNTSLESEALLDHRGQQTLTQRRRSVHAPHIFQPRPSQAFVSSPQRLTQSMFGRSKLSSQHGVTDSEHDDNDNAAAAEDDDADDRTPLMGGSYRDIRAGDSYGATSLLSNSARRRGDSKSPTVGGLQGANLFAQHHSPQAFDRYDVNNPPSVPASPVLGPGLAFNDVMITEDLDEPDHSPEPESKRSRSRDALINIDEASTPAAAFQSNPTSPPVADELHRRLTLSAADDVCFPQEGMSEMGPEDYLHPPEHYMHRPEAGDPRNRRRRRRWPDLGALDTWSRLEKEQRTIEGLRMRKVSEPLMVEGRLRPQKRTWHREADDAPFRFTYFNECFESTVHSQTISELVPPGQTFRNLFIPDPPVLEDSSDDETDTDDEIAPSMRDTSLDPNVNGNPRAGPRLSKTSSGDQTRSSTPGYNTPKPGQEKPKRYGQRPPWWLDVMNPTTEEMRVLCRAFSIHPLTSEDIMMQEQREKVELFKHYYFINYRTFEQDENSEDFMEPVNLYVVVFREGVISFHFSMTPHPANVRRRIRQLQDYLVLTPDWISYGIIDDITDAYAPLIQRIEEEVDEIDEAILRLHSLEEEQEAKKQKQNPFHSEKDSDGNKETQESGRDMLRRIGECRKKVMSLYRLLGNKADVIKGFAKRCNEQWEVAPRSEIGMYLGDIQDHIVTMTGNLSHYENLLSRAHSNYLAQISIRMSERQEKTSDILGKLTVMGTIVLPMNVVTGIWGMNCLVPGQDIDSLTWFWCITSGLIMFGLFCFLIAKRVYGIV